MKRRINPSVLFWMYFLPLKRNGILFLLLCLLVGVFISKQYYSEPNQLVAFLDVFAWVIGLFAVFIIGFGLLYLLVCWIYLIATRNTLTIDFSIGLEDGKKGIAGIVPMKLTVSKLLMPFLGFLKARLVLEDGSVIGPFMINRFSGGWKDLKVKAGMASLRLERRKQYHIRGFLFSFEDYLQFFRLSYFYKNNKSFYLRAKEKEVQDVTIPLSKAREELEKVRTSKRVEGDFLNYKDFESGDDVRRIVWKIFAKSKELVVRIPEVINPYASHLSILASFQNTLATKQSSFIDGMLDYYKDMLFNTYREIEKSGRKIDFQLDQKIDERLIVEKKDKMGYALSCAQWTDIAVQDSLPTSQESTILCVSSLVPAAQIEALLNKRGIVFLIVNVSRYLDEQNLFNPMNLIMRSDNKSEVSKLKWQLSGLRKKLKRNEKRIEELMQQENFQGQVL
ncbi:MAG: DUF58 domain-containing protein [Bacteroidota bacterium]